jgi:hypothetical protein
MHEVVVAHGSGKLTCVIHQVASRIGDSQGAREDSEEEGDEMQERQRGQGHRQRAGTQRRGMKELTVWSPGGALQLRQQFDDAHHVEADGSEGGEVQCHVLTCVLLQRVRRTMHRNAPMH